jgi:hypothetical protein
MTPPAAATSATRPAALPRAPRRVSGPAPARSRRPAAVEAPTLGPRIAAAAKALPDHRLLDRLVRGRAWIVLIGMALIGIVAMQVSLLKLNAGIGHDVQRASVLQRENDVLRAEDSSLAEGQRVERTAARAGLIAPNPGSVRFVAERRGNAARAAGALAHPRPVMPVTTGDPTTPPVTSKIPLTSTTGAPTAAATAPVTTTPSTLVAPTTTTPSTVAPSAGTGAPATGTPATPAGQG